MTETAPTVEEQSPVPAEIQAGDLTAKLTEYRDQAGMDLTQAAEEMHLSLQILRALEAEDFDNLPEPPYVRGYLRGYAKLADADARELIRIYEALRGADPDDIAHHFAPPRPVHHNSQPIISASTLKFIGFGAIVLLLGVVSMIPGVREWANHTWSSFSAQTNPPQTPDLAARPPGAMEAFSAQKAAREKAEAEQKAAQEEAAAQAVAAVGTTETTDDKDTSAAQVEDKQAAETAVQDDKAGDDKTATTDAAAEQDKDKSKDKAEDTAQASDAAAQDKKADAEKKASDTETQANADTAAEDEQEQTANAEINIKLEFTEDVWMRVKDAKQKKTLFESLNKAGAIKEFKAKPPLDFKIGNAPGVKIYLDGKLFDQSAHMKGSIARFKVE